MDNESNKPETPEDGKVTQPEPTSEVPFDEKVTASDPADVQSRVEAAVLATQTEAEKQTGDRLIGTLMGERFQVTSRIGAGGMGIVYKARQAGMDRWVAVKVLLKELTHDEKVIKRFKIEALAASRLTHPNTIRIYDFGITQDDILYIAMEFLDGSSLEESLRKGGPMSARRTLHVLKQIASSLAEAHDKGIVHRDLKPDNIFLTTVDGDNDFVKVLDFGVAKLREADKNQGTLTQAGVIFGTPRYMAPEQCRSLAVDHRADLYALGIIGYECLTGIAPFDAESPLSILIQHVQEPPRKLPDIRPDIEVPEELEALVMRCLEKKAEHRFQDARELVVEASRIEAQLAGRYERVVFVSGPRVVPPDREASEARTSLDTVNVEESEIHRPVPPTRRIWPWGLGSVVLFGGLLGGLWAGGVFETEPVPAVIEDGVESSPDAWDVPGDPGVASPDTADAPSPDPGAGETLAGDKGTADIVGPAPVEPRKPRRKKPSRSKVKAPVETPEAPVMKKDKGPSRIQDLRGTGY